MTLRNFSKNDADADENADASEHGHYTHGQGNPSQNFPGNLRIEVQIRRSHLQVPRIPGRASKRGLKFGVCSLLPLKKVAIVLYNGKILLLICMIKRSLTKITVS